MVTPAHAPERRERRPASTASRRRASRVAAGRGALAAPAAAGRPDRQCPRAAAAARQACWPPERALGPAAAEAVPVAAPDPGAPAAALAAAALSAATLHLALAAHGRLGGSGPPARLAACLLAAALCAPTVAASVGDALGATDEAAMVSWTTLRLLEALAGVARQATLRALPRRDASAPRLAAADGAGAAAARVALALVAGAGLACTPGLGHLAMPAWLILSPPATGRRPPRPLAGPQ